MKLQNLSVIFIVIIIPIILIVSYYISLQVDTINMQTAYNTKLLESTKEAIEAFEINTVEWNDAYSETADSKRRDIMASINTFTTSFSNSIGMGGASKETVLSYVPAIAFTLYDGYYIYSPAETKEVIKDDNGVAVFMSRELANDIGYASYDEAVHKGKILYVAERNPQDTYTTEDGESKQFTLNPGDAKTTYSHILKPFTAYSARYKKEVSDTDITVNYTLDNYITIYGKVNGVYEKKSGYLIDTDTAKITMPVETINGIKLNENIDIKPETLSEKIAWKITENGPYTVGTYTYVYEAENNTKVYFDGNTPFQVSSTGIRTNLSDLSSVKYKKLSIYENKVNNTCIEIYQALIGNCDSIEQGKWYTDTKSGVEVTSDYGQPNDPDSRLYLDTSAVNYYVESYAFSEWVYDKLGSITVGDMQGETGEITITGTIFDDIEKENSVFNLHKREVIKQAVISNLNQAITSYSRNSPGEFFLPVLSETDWDKILDNVSIITFVQGIPIGMKYYNNYAIATSTSNKEYVDPDEIYLNSNSDMYYHLPYCDEINGSNLKGYRSIDYRIKSYEYDNAGTEETWYYYKHAETNTSKEECYYCLVQRSLYEKDIDDEKTTAYETALAREKYAARTTSIPNPVTADLGGAPGGDTPGGGGSDDGSGGGGSDDGSGGGGSDDDTLELPNSGDVIVEKSNDDDEDITEEIYIPQDGYYEIILVAGGGGGIEGSWILQEWWYIYGGGSGAGFKRNRILVRRKL